MERTTKICFSLCLISCLLLLDINASDSIKRPVCYFRFRIKNLINAEGLYKRNACDMFFENTGAVTSRIRFGGELSESTRVNYLYRTIHSIKLPLRWRMIHWQNKTFKGLDVLEVKKDAFNGFDTSGKNKDRLFRLTSKLAYKFGQLSFYREMEYTGVIYEKFKLSDPVKVLQTKLIYNFRPTLTAYFFF